MSLYVLEYTNTYIFVCQVSIYHGFYRKHDMWKISCRQSRREILLGSRENLKKILLGEKDTTKYHAKKSNGVIEFQYT